MVIRMTVEDVEYTNIVKRFADGLIENLIGSINFDVNNLSEMEENFERCSRIVRIIKSGKTNEETDSDKGYLVKQIRNAFTLFVENERKSAYLINNFSILITDSMTDIDENGEVVYWLCNSRMVIVQ